MVDGNKWNQNQILIVYVQCLIFLILMTTKNGENKIGELEVNLIIQEKLLKFQIMKFIINSKPLGLHLINGFVHCVKNTVIMTYVQSTVSLEANLLVTRIILMGNNKANITLLKLGQKRLISQLKIFLKVKLAKMIFRNLLKQLLKN